MRHLARLAGPTWAFAFVATMASADLTAEEVWTNWQAIAADMGQSYNVGSQTRTGDGLTLRDIVVEASASGARLTGVIEEIALQELGDGTVLITPSAVYTMTSEATAANGEMLRQKVTVTQDNLRLVASGTTDAVRYDFTSDRIALQSVGSSAQTGADGNALVAADGVAGRYVVRVLAPSTLEAAFSAESLSLAAAIDDGLTGVVLEMDAADIAVTSLSDIGGTADFGSYLAAGLSGTGALSYSDLNIRMDVTEAGNQAIVTTAAQSGTVDLTVADRALRYAFATTGLRFGLSGSEIPFPQIGIAAAETRFDLRFPVLVGDTPEDFALDVTLDEVTLDDPLWQAIDPGGLLPRDPARLDLGLTGMANWKTAILDPDVTAPAVATPPGELHALQIDRLDLQLGGAALSGSGAFTFDNSDFATFRGLPAPDGAVELQASGLNALVDNLVTLGLISWEQAFFARVVVAPFLQAGSGPDTLRTRIEIQPDGRITANGQRVR